MSLKTVHTHCQNTGLTGVFERKREDWKPKKGSEERRKVRVAHKREEKGGSSERNKVITYKKPVVEGRAEKGGGVTRRNRVTGTEKRPRLVVSFLKRKDTRKREEMGQPRAVQRNEERVAR